CDAYVNIAGGMKVQEPAIDLAIVLAALSSFKNREVSPRLVAFGEVGLSGEVRSVSMAAQRVAEARKLGFDTCILPEVCMKGLKSDGAMKLVGVRTIQDAVNAVL
ncbi:MAG: DNA repair protein RadA, partial [Acetatifactor sp.]|nr:DNA repair protein RadA [Acetatifactor sp.]